VPFDRRRRSRHGQRRAAQRPGLVGMAERVAILGGSLALTPSPRGGLRVAVRAGPQDARQPVEDKPFDSHPLVDDHAVVRRLPALRSAATICGWSARPRTRRDTASDSVHCRT
jgi:hypothetical protein